VSWYALWTKPHAVSEQFTANYHIQVQQLASITPAIALYRVSPCYLEDVYIILTLPASHLPNYN